MNERFPSAEGSARSAIERATRIMGQEHVHGPRNLQKAFKIALPLDTVPLIPFTTKELQRAQEHAETLIYRPTPEQCGQGLTIQRMMGLLKRKHHFFAFNTDLPKITRHHKLDFFTAETPTPGWTLIRAEEIEGTRHLSYDAQQAFLAKDTDGLATALRQMEKAWDAARIPHRLRPTIPGFEELRMIRKSLPDDAELPSAVDVIFDLLLHATATKEHLLQDMTSATSTTIPQMSEIDKLGNQPVDISFPAEGLKIHWRKSTAFGRLKTINDIPIPGAPIGYFQHH